MSVRHEKAPRQRGLVIVNKAERLIIDLAPHIDKIPKHQRYRYAARLEGELWELVSRIIEAAAVLGGVRGGVGLARAVAV